MPDGIRQMKAMHEQLNSHWKADICYRVSDAAVTVIATSRSLISRITRQIADLRNSQP